eukprot:Gb_36351 [translate_table: standard]
MEGILGILKVHIIKGSGLAIRDLSSSDPYVVVRLDNQCVRTRVIKSNLNPVWNEELSLAISDPTQPLKLQVMDKDRFSADETLGDAEVDLQPLVAAAEEFKAMIKEKNVREIGRVLAAHNNALVNDSVILLNDDKIVQNLCLNLRHVESGTIQIELRWVYI